MATTLRVATFNLENLGKDPKPTEPTLAERIAVMKPQLVRLRADILCLQEVFAQEPAGQPRDLYALQDLIAGTQYADPSYSLVSTTTASGKVRKNRNLVILSGLPIAAHAQYEHDIIPAPSYRKVVPPDPDQTAQPVGWERPILHAQITLPDNSTLHVMTVHLKSRIAVPKKKHMADPYTWNIVSGWAQGYFLSSMKRVGQALEMRLHIDELFDQDPKAQIIVCGDFNAEPDEVPVAAIRGEVEDTGNPAHGARVMVPCERTVPEPARYTLFHRGKGEMLDHLLMSRSLVAHYRDTEIHNEILHDESIAFAGDKKHPESDHAPVVAEFVFP